MSSSAKFRFHMGCGEPLQSRWWVARSARAQSSAQQGSKPNAMRNDGCATQRGGKCK